MVFSAKIYGFFLNEELEEEGVYTLCFSMAKVSHSPVQKGLQEWGPDVWGGIVGRPACLLKS